MQSWMKRFISVQVDISKSSNYEIKLRDQFESKRVISQILSTESAFMFAFVASTLNHPMLIQSLILE